jgi:hypothetical protein
LKLYDKGYRPGDFVMLTEYGLSGINIWSITMPETYEEISSFWHGNLVVT